MAAAIYDISMRHSELFNKIWRIKIIHGKCKLESLQKKRKGYNYFQL